MAAREEAWKGGITGIVEGWPELHNLERWGASTGSVRAQTELVPPARILTIAQRFSAGNFGCK
jgi:hypothetical protein